MTGLEFLWHAGVTFIPAENWWLCCPGNLARRKSLGGVTTIRAIWLYSMAPIVWQCYANCYERQSGEILRAWTASETVALLLSNHTSTLLNLPPCTVSLIIQVHGVNCFNSLCLFVWDCVCRALPRERKGSIVYNTKSHSQQWQGETLHMEWLRADWDDGSTAAKQPQGNVDRRHHGGRAP